MIYFVEDDNSIRKLVLYSLTSTGLEVEGFAHPEQFWAAMEKKLPQVILLDIMLPGEDGLTILKKLRADRRTENTQIILITARGSEFDKVVGLDAGADDYVAKPFGMMELMARVRTALRRAGQSASADPIYTFGPLTVDSARHQVHVDGEEIVLTRKEFQLLALLLEHQDTVFTRDQLLSSVWGYDFDGASRTVDVHIRTLRQKLGAAGAYI
ncbi:MAG: response regulator transcription factor, partial [Oscillospiraceae bacterium]|nr:response regulator transcription factor [Oscillospiraceae bacterium]